MYPVTFPAGKYAYFFLLIAAGKVEFTYVRAGVKRPACQHHIFRAARNDLKNRFIRIEAFVLLVHIGNFHGWANGNGTGIRFFAAAAL